MMRLQNQVVVVTGAGRGIGYALAERFRRRAKVVIAEKIPDGAHRRKTSHI
jgi:NAD(P)-dependent dehydrogenase (short-subunit alcohol dehydrogenase family)